MDDIEIAMMTFETYMNELPGIDVSVSGIENNIFNMTQSFSAISQNIAVVTTEIDALQNILAGVGQNTLVLKQVLQQVTGDVADGVKPIKRFNSINPFGFFR